MFKRSIYIAIALLACLTPAHAQFMSGNHFHRACLERPDLALGFAVAVAENEDNPHKAISADGTRYTPRKIVCIPENVVTGQIVEIACASIAKRPADRQFSAATMVAVALAEAWPCNQ